MKSIYNASDRNELLERARHITSSSARQWGTMQPDQMLRHINLSIKYYLSDSTESVAYSRVKAAIIRTLALSPLPIPKGKAKTFSEMEANDRYDFTAEQNRFVNLLTELAKRNPELPIRTSPVFGNMDRESFGKHTWKHLDHHLRQFGA